MTITISNEDLHTANTRLVQHIADLERELDTANGESRDAQATAGEFQQQRDRARADRQDAVDTAARLLARLGRVDRELAAAKQAGADIAATVTDVMRENGQLHDRVGVLTRENDQFRVENAGLEELRREVARFAPTAWWRRHWSGR
jgi:chromosome segregation ATPase